MLWKALHERFGWDYVHCQNLATDIVRRVHYTAQGERFVKYWSSYLIFIDRPNCGWIVSELTKD